MSLVLCAACSASETAPSDTPTPLTIASVSLEGGSHILWEPRRTVVRSEAAWRDEWAFMFGESQTPPARPPVDFTKEMVVVAAMGMKPSGGYAIRISAAVAVSDDVTVEVLSTLWGGCGGVTDSLTFPIHVVRLARRDGDVSFAERGEKTPCP